MKRLAILTVLCLVVAAPAFAQGLSRQRRPVIHPIGPPPDYRHHASLFVGAAASSRAGLTLGGAYGGGSPGFGFELELARTGSSQIAAGWEFVTFSVSFYGAIPVTLWKTELYAIGGIGLWSERAGVGNGGGGFAKNVGFGAKYRLAGPFRARAEYRLFLLDTEDASDNWPSRPFAHRVIVGACVGC